MHGFWAHLWKFKVRLIAIWIVVMVLVLLRLMGMSEVFTSSCVLMPLPLQQVEEGASGGFGRTSVRNLLAGGGSTDAYAVAAFLKSGQLMDRVIEDQKLARELFSKRWDDKADKWRGEAPHPGKSRRAFAHHIEVSYNGFTGLLDLQVHWWSAEKAQQIASAMVTLSDELLREAAIADGERRIEELTREMREMTLSEIGSFLAEETTQAVASLASIRARSGYAFRVIDPPLVPDKKSWPPRLILLILAGMATAVVEVGAVAGVYARRGVSRGSASAYQ